MQKSASKPCRGGAWFPALFSIFFSEDSSSSPFRLNAPALKRNEITGPVRRPGHLPTHLPRPTMTSTWQKLGVFSLLLLAACRPAATKSAEIEVPTRPFLDQASTEVACVDIQRGMAISAGSDYERRARSAVMGCLLLWDLGKNELVKEVPMPASIFNLALDRRHHRVAIAGGPTRHRDNTPTFLIIYDYVSCKVLYEAHGEQNYDPRQLAWTDGSEGLAAAGSNGNTGTGGEVAWLLDLSQGMDRAQWRQWPGHSADVATLCNAKNSSLFTAKGITAFHPTDEDGGIFLGRRGSQGLLVDGASTRIVGTIGLATKDIKTHAVAEDGSALAVMVGRSTVMVWDFLTMTQHVVEGLPVDLLPQAGIRPGQGGTYLRLALSKDGRHLYLALCASSDEKYSGDEAVRQVFVWDVARLRLSEIKNLPPHDGISLTSLKRGQLIMSKDGQLSLYHLLTGSAEALRTAPQHSRMVDLAVSPSGRYLWRSCFAPETTALAVQTAYPTGLELVAADKGNVLLCTPAGASSQQPPQCVSYDYLEGTDTFIMGTAGRAGTGGYSYSELNLFRPTDTSSGQVQMPLSDPEGASRNDPSGPALDWCGFLKTQGRWLIGAARANGSLESFDPASGHAMASPRRDPLIEASLELSKPCSIPGAGRVVLRRPDGGLRFLQLEPDGTWTPFADLVVGQENQWLLRLATGGYWTTLSGPAMVKIRQNGVLTPLSHLDLAFNRPHEVAKVFGAPPQVVGRLESLWQARLARHGLTFPPSAEPSALPTVTLEDPPFLHTGAAWSPHINWRAAAQPVTSLHILVNRVPEHGLDGLRVEAGGSFWTGEVRLASGLNDLEIFVRDAAGNDSVHWHRRVWVEPSARKPDLYYFGIGISDYQDDRLRLEYPAKDVRDLSARLLQAQERFGKIIINIVKDSEATREAILQAAQALRQSQPDDYVIIFIAGHGFLDERNRYFFGTRDVDPLHPAQRGLSYPDMQGLFNGVPALKRIMLVDTCHAGEADTTAAAPVLASSLQTRGAVVRPLKHRDAAPAPAAGGARGADDLARQLFTDLRVDTGAQVICASQAAEVAYEGGDTAHNGWFTYCLLKHLAVNDGDTDGDGRTTVAEVAQAVSEGVRALSGGLQNPVLREGGDATRFAFWPGESERLAPREMLQSYLDFAAKASAPPNPHLASLLFAPHARYYGQDVVRPQIEQDITEEGRKYSWITYTPANLRIQPGAGGARVLHYDLGLSCSGSGPMREGTVPCRMELAPSGASWLITSLEATGKGSFKQPPQPAVTPIVPAAASVPPSAPSRGGVPRDPAAFLAFYLGAAAQSRNGDVAAMFTSRATYFDKTLSRAEIQADAIDYGRKYDRVTQTANPSTVTVQRLKNGRVRLTYMLQFTATSSLRGETRRGLAPSEMILQPATDGGWLITSLRYTGKVQIETLKR